MRHRIGLNYTEILKSRKDKRQLPLAGRLARTIAIGPLQDQIAGLLKFRERSPNQDFATFDPASSEHNYHLKTAKGESFIRNYDEFYAQYSTIGLQELSDEAREHASRLTFKTGDLSPVMRLKGMKDTGYSRYHPYYDERNYTKPTRFFEGECKKLLDGFAGEPCRAAVVCLRPNQFISPHFDIGPEYITRTMVPVFTNEKAVVGVRGEGGYYEFHFPADGGIYFINAGVEHYAINGGDQPRFQIRVCINGQEDLEGMTAMEPLRFIPDAEFVAHPCAPVPHPQPQAKNILAQTLGEFNLEKSGKARLT